MYCERFNLTFSTAKGDFHKVAVNTFFLIFVAAVLNDWVTQTTTRRLNNAKSFKQNLLHQKSLTYWEVFHSSPGKTFLTPGLWKKNYFHVPNLTNKTIKLFIFQ